MYNERKPLEPTNSGRCSEVIYVIKVPNGPQNVVVIGWWLLFGGGRLLRFDCIVQCIDKKSQIC
jgi:hypothetical protein